VQQLTAGLLCGQKTFCIAAGVCCKIFLQVLRKARIVGMTTSGVAIMQKLITALQPKVPSVQVRSLTVTDHS
jgi:hypothetical protein